MLREGGGGGGGLFYRHNKSNKDGRDVSTWHAEKGLNSDGGVMRHGCTLKLKSICRVCLTFVR